MKRRLAICYMLFLLGGTECVAEKIRFFIGGNTQSKTEIGEAADGIGMGWLDTEDGSMEMVGESPPIASPGHLCVSTDGGFLYSVSRSQDSDGKPLGSVTAFKIEPGSGEMEELGTVSSQGEGPCYVTLDRSGKFAMVANYSGGTAAVYRIEEGGTLGEPSAVVVHNGKSVHPSRQDGPHPHSIVASPDNRFVYVPDLGIDRIVAYELDSETGKLLPRPDLDTVTPPGSGPRHLIFDPQGRFAYVSLEMSNDLAAYQYDQGRLIEIGIHSTLPEDFREENTTAEVRTAPDGKTVYISNRGHDSIAVFRKTDEKGTLRRVQIIGSGGQRPRNFGVDPSGRVLIAANLNTHNLVSFFIDPETGELEPAGKVTPYPFPMIVCFQPIGN